MTIDDATRRRAQEIWNKNNQHQSVLDAVQVARRVEAAKTARLRDLRLAKEAADRLSSKCVQFSRRKRSASPAR